MPTDFIDFLPIAPEDVDSVRGRYDADVNAGLAPGDPGFHDTTIGGMYWDLTQPSVLEHARLWDFFTEMVAAQVPGTAWGDYLDNHGETIGLTRKDEVRAVGVVLFSGTQGLLIPAGTEVSTVQPDPSADTDPVQFTTDRSITLAATPGPVNLAGVPNVTGGILVADGYYYVVTALDAGGNETIASNEVSEVVSGGTSSIDLTWGALTGATAYRVYRAKVSGEEQFLAQIGSGVKPAPTGVTATPSASGGSLAAGTRYYKVTAVDSVGQTTASAEVSATVPGGGAGSVTLAWNKVEGAKKYRVYEGATGAENTYWETTFNSYHDTGAAGTAGTPPGSNTTSGTAFTDTGADTVIGPAFAPTNTVPVTAEVAGSVGNVEAGTITQVISPLAPPPSVTNAAPTSGGADVETDARFRERVLAAYSSATGAGNVSDYINWAQETPQVGFVTVQPLWNGPGTVRVIVNDQDNHPLPSSVVQIVQDRLDPIPQQGAGKAPIGANVTVVSTTGLPIAVTAKIVFQGGYSLDGTGGTIPTRDTINRALNTYLETLPPGADVILTAVVRQLMSVPGVIDVQGPGGTGLPQLNGSAANVTVAPLEVAEPGAYTLST